jgi:hypothetical protein
MFAWRNARDARNMCPDFMADGAGRRRCEKRRRIVDHKRESDRPNVLTVSVSNSLLGGDWELDEIPCRSPIFRPA